MFSKKEFIEASRKFVCVRLESYESLAHQDLIRTFLDGRFENTAFCILAPDAEERLSRTGRSPNQGLASARGAGRNTNDEGVVESMEKIAKSYRPKGNEDEMTLQDFHSFRQALNVASGDQRLLLFVSAPATDQEKVKGTLKPVFADKDVIGRFHLDFADAAEDAKWADSIKKSPSKPSIVLIHADEFGQSGRAIDEFPLTASADDIKAALLKANEGFALAEVRKSYGDHVSAGRREGIHFENEMEYGEDRDGDGKIDHVGGQGREKGMKGKGGKGKGRPQE